MRYFKLPVSFENNLLYLNRIKPPYTKHLFWYNNLRIINIHSAFPISCTLTYTANITVVLHH